MDRESESTAVSRRIRNVRMGSRCVYKLLVLRLYPDEAGRSHNMSWGENMPALMHRRILKHKR